MCCPLIYPINANQESTVSLTENITHMSPHLGMQVSLSYQVFLPQECFQSEKTADLTLNCYSLRKTLD